VRGRPDAGSTLPAALLAALIVLSVGGVVLVAASALLAVIGP
jgi:hypothetical protein